MSTDYGFKCTDCGEEIVIENFRFWAAEHVLRNFDKVAQMYNLALELDCATDIKPYWLQSHTQFGDLAEFAQAHKGHQIIIVDEYGGIHNE